MNAPSVPPSPQSGHLSVLIRNTMERGGRGLYAITGPAGAGKSVAAGLAGDITGSTVYSADCRFIGSSLERRALLIKKQLKSVEAYQDSVNQFNWWDWGNILSDVEDLLAGRPVRIPGAYDRATGGVGGALDLAPTDRIIYEGAILGPPYLVNKCVNIFFLWIDPAIRFQRLLEKDGSRRSFNEICARFLITEYSETLYYSNLIKWARPKIIFIDALTGLPRGQPELPADLFVPLRATGLTATD